MKTLNENVVDNDQPRPTLILLYQNLINCRVFVRFLAYTCIIQCLPTKWVNISTYIRTNIHKPLGNVKRIFKTRALGQYKRQQGSWSPKHNSHYLFS